MNPLQISLIAVAIVVVAAIVLYNWLQERKYRRQAREMFAKQSDIDPAIEPVVVAKAQPDIASNAQRVEPHLESPRTRVPPTPTPVTARASAPLETREMAVAVEKNPSPMISPAKITATHAPQSSESKPMPIGEAAHPAKDTQPAAGLPASPADPAIDFEVRLHAVEPIPGAVIAGLIEACGQSGKPLYGWGYNPLAQAWEEIAARHENACSEIAIALQLADRNGAASEEQLAQLCAQAQQIAQRYNGVMECPEIAPALRQASELDLFCVDVDVLIGLNVVSRQNQVFVGVRIAELARRAGMVLAVDGVYQSRNAAGEVVYSLCNHESTPFSVDAAETFTTHGVTLLFDLPRVADGLAAFDRMAALVQQVAEQLGGELVDDNIRPLTQAGIDKIRAQIAQIYARMDARGIPAGSERALRLFH